jgi:hypothetical protein
VSAHVCSHCGAETTYAEWVAVVPFVTGKGDGPVEAATAALEQQDAVELGHRVLAVPANLVTYLNVELVEVDA